MQVINNFDSSMPKYLDSRQKWASLNALVANIDNIVMPNGFKVYCEAEKSWYQLSTTDPKDLSTYTWTKEHNTFGFKHNTTENVLELVSI